MSDFPSLENLPGILRERLGEHQPEIKPEWEATPAAVLIPLYQENSAWHALFTRRTEDVDSHRGQVSFPGGVIEPSDASPEKAALREAEEEIGIQPADVDVLGALNSLLTVTQFLVFPVVGIIPWPYTLKINQNEVANTFGVPIDWLADPDNLRVEHRQAFIPGQEIKVYFFEPFADEIIWGVTARIALDLLQVLKKDIS